MMAAGLAAALPFSLSFDLVAAVCTREQAASTRVAPWRTKRAAAGRAPAAGPEVLEPLHPVRGVKQAGTRPRRRVASRCHCPHLGGCHLCDLILFTRRGRLRQLLQLSLHPAAAISRMKQPSRISRARPGTCARHCQQQPVHQSPGQRAIWRQHALQQLEAADPRPSLPAAASCSPRSGWSPGAT